jgi:hypothetical protein
VAGLVRFRRIVRVRPGAQALLAVASFGVGVGLAGLLGASSLGVAFAFGQIAFALCCVGLILRA